MKVIGKNQGKQYTLKSIIGVGSYGKVYISPPYAIKQITLNLSSYLKSALQNQIKILKSFKHKNIVQLFDVIYQDNFVYLVMQYCQMDLSKYIKKYKVDEKLAINILRQILQGFRQLTNQGIIHRDLKPANILVNSKGQFKLADFGFAKFVQHFDSKMLQTIVGTPLYMAPQILKKTNYTTKCDIWSIGFIFYELVCGQLPWSGYSQSNLLDNIIKNPLIIPQKVSDWCRQILKKMLIVNQNDRISWDDLFKYFLGKLPRERSQSHTKSHQKDRPRHNTPQKTNIRSQKLLPKPIPQPKQYIACYQQNLIDLFTIELKDYFDSEKSRKIATGRPYKVSFEDQDKIIDILQLFSDEFQKILKQNLIFTSK